MRATATMFGSEARQLLFDDPPQLPNELVLLDELRIKLGPQPPTDRLLHHIRASRGKLHCEQLLQGAHVRQPPAGLPGPQHPLPPRCPFPAPTTHSCQHPGYF
ncbi:hypothetical protein V8C86DRAFT_2547877 [Haematococcus lacustris]